MLNQHELYSGLLLVELKLVTFLWNFYSKEVARSSCKSICLKLFDMLLESSTITAIDQHLI
jgi:hypothetical protein